MKRLIFGVIAGFGAASVLFLNRYKKVKSENKLLIENALIQQRKKDAILNTNKPTDNDYRKYSKNT